MSNVLEEIEADTEFINTLFFDPMVVNEPPYFATSYGDLIRNAPDIKTDCADHQSSFLACYIGNLAAMAISTRNTLSLALCFQMLRMEVIIICLSATFSAMEKVNG